MLIARIVVLVLALGCGDGSGPPTPTTPSTRPAPPPSSSSTTIPAAGAPHATVAPPTTADDGRRILEQRGIDPDRLSEEIAEQMRRRFEPQPPR